MKSYTLFSIMATLFFILGLCYLLEFMIIAGGVLLYLSMLFAGVATKLKDRDCVKTDLI